MAKPRTSGKTNENTFDDEELEAIEELTPIRAPAIFEAVRRKGEEELARPASALLLSGLVAGLALGLSVLTEGLLRSHLPDTQWRPIVESFGYSVGFLVVILGQMQLFTENTITAVCPALDTPCRPVFERLFRLWGLVLVTNVVGASLLGFVLNATAQMQPEVWEAVRSISLHALGFGWTETMLRGIGAGWLIAALVWIMPNSGGAKLFVIVLMTWLIALADFAHVIAGTTEAAFLTFSGDRSAYQAITEFFLPALIGNILGGTVFFTLLTWAQIRSELAEDEPDWRPEHMRRLQGGREKNP